MQLVYHKIYELSSVFSLCGKKGLSPAWLTEALDAITEKTRTDADKSLWR